MELIRKLSASILLLSFITLIGFGFMFMFMLHVGGMGMTGDCAITESVADCPMTISSHISSWQGIRFIPPTLFILYSIFATIAVGVLLALQKFFSGLRLVPAHWHRDSRLDKGNNIESQRIKKWLSLFELSPSH